jgi:RsiW-degrading membrane proteinase PrsW (M82 family)
MLFFVLLGLALAPGLAIMLYIYWNDTHEKEPIRLLFISFMLGLLSIVVTLTISAIIFPWFTIDESNILHQAFSAFILVALVEEFSKYIFIKGIIYRKPDFNEPYDGIVYTVMIGMGFATGENIMYVLDGGLEVALWRMFTAVPAHATFAILMGYFIGKEKFSNLRRSYGLLGLLVATLFHGAYDFFLFINFIPGISLAAIVSLIIAVILSKKAIKAHQDISPFRKMDSDSDPPLRER